VELWFAVYKMLVRQALWAEGPHAHDYGDDETLRRGSRRKCLSQACTDASSTNVRFGSRLCENAGRYDLQAKH
jgi:hypothetical protein